MQQEIKKLITESIEVKKKVLNSLVPEIEKASKTVINALKSGNKILIFGNGGSAADSQHIAAEFVNRFKINRNPLPAIALTTDTSIITSCGNDFGFELIFLRQVQALAKKGDVLIGLSTSGNSENVLLALEEGKQAGCINIGLLGSGGGKIAQVVDINLTVPSNDTPRIQESHITIAHIICEIVEKEIFNG